MKLNVTETEWISNKLNSYDIKYQEIYDELNDHLISAVEELRSQGDEREVQTLFDEVMRAQFPGFWPFDDIVKEYQSAYRKKISKAMQSSFYYYLNWKTLPVLGLMVLAGFYLPHNKATTVTMMIALIIAAVIPMLYGYIYGRKIKPNKGKKSLLKSYIQFQSNFLVLISNVIINLLGSLSREWKPASFLSPFHYAPVVFMLMFGFFCIYGLGCIRLARQGFNAIEGK